MSKDEGKEITVVYDGERNATITPHGNVTFKQLRAMERIQEWFTLRNATYTIQADGWINEVQK